MGRAWQQRDGIHGRADARASLGLWHWEGSSKSPVSTGTAPASLSSVANPGRAVVSARGSCVAPFHLALPAQALTEICSHPGGHSWGQVCSATGSKPSWFSSITPGSTSHLPIGFLGASSRLPRPHHSPQGAVGTWCGAGETAAVPWAGDGCAVPGSHSSLVPFQLLQVSTRHVGRSFLPFPFLINFISIAEGHMDRPTATLALAECGAELSLQIWGELGAGRR